MSLTVGEHEYARRRIPTYVTASDPTSRAGLASRLRDNGLTVVADAKEAAVAVIVVDQDDEAARSIRSLIRSGCLNVVVVATLLDDRGDLKAVEAGLCAVMRRAAATAERLASALVAARKGHRTRPPDPLGTLLAEVGRLGRNVSEPRGQLNGFAEREIEVLRLIADGYDTSEIAEKLAYSERTVKHIVHDVTSRFNLRNRCHAVAYALRAGVI